MSSEAWVGVIAMVVTVLGSLIATVYYGGRMTANTDSMLKDFSENKQQTAECLKELIRAKNDHEHRITAVEVRCTLTHSGAHGE